MRPLVFLAGLMIFTLRGVWFLLKAMVPRFVTVECACDINQRGEFVPVLDMEWVTASDEFDGIATFRFFTWLWLGLLPKAVTPLRPWVNPHQMR